MRSHDYSGWDRSMGSGPWSVMLRPNTHAMMLCWVHEGRPCKKLIPFVALNWTAKCWMTFSIASGITTTHCWRTNNGPLISSTPTCWDDTRDYTNSDTTFVRIQIDYVNWFREIKSPSISERAWNDIGWSHWQVRRYTPWPNYDPHYIRLLSENLFFRWSLKNDYCHCTFIFRHPQMAETNTPQPMDVTERVSLYDKFMTGILACTFRRWVCYNPDR